MATKKSAATHENKYQKYERKQKECGFVKIHIWTPEKDADAVKNYAAKKRKSHLKRK